MTTDPDALELVRLERIRKMVAYCDEKYPDQICTCQKDDCGECSNKFLLAYIDRLTPPAEARRDVASALRAKAEKLHAWIAIVDGLGGDSSAIVEDETLMRRAADMLEE